MTTPTPDTRPSVEAAAERFNRYLAGDSLYAIYQEMPREKTYEKLDMDQATLANAYLAQSPTYAELCADYTKTSMECIDLSREVARLEAECNHDRLFARTVLASLHWTGDGYEWTGGRFDYRMEPATAAALTAGEIERLREENKKLTTDLAAARAENDELEVTLDDEETAHADTLRQHDLQVAACDEALAEIERLKAIGSELVSSEIDWQHMTAQQQREYLDREKVIRSQAAAFAATELVSEEWCRANGFRPSSFLERWIINFGPHEGHRVLWIDLDERGPVYGVASEDLEYSFVLGGGIPTTGDLLKLLSAIGGAK